MAIKKKEFDKLSSMKNSKLVEEIRKAKKELMEMLNLLDQFVKAQILFSNIKTLHQ